MGKLTDAVAKNDIETVKKLLKGEYRNSQLIDEEMDKEGHPSLHIAAKSGYVEVIKLLLNAGAKIDQLNKIGQAALLIAAANGKIDAIKLLLNGGANINQAEKNEWSGAPLHLAAQCGHANAVQVLLDNGADINQLASYGPALFTAAYNNQVEVIRVLLKAGADVNTKISNGQTPLDIAKEKGHKVIVTLLENHIWLWPDLNASAGKLVNAVIRNDIQRVEKLLAGEYRNSRLINDEVAISGENKEYFCALGIAARNGFTEIVKLLIKAGANVNQLMNNDDATPIYTAADNGHIEIMHALIKAGANINQPRKNGMTPLFTTAYKGQIEALQTLINVGANINQPDHEGWTPLHIATWFGYVNAIQPLLKGGADVKAKLKAGNTPLDIARQKGHTQIVKLLEEHIQPKKDISNDVKAPLNITKSEDVTAVHKLFEGRSKQFSNSNSSIKYNDITMGNKLGQGAFGIVYQGTYRHNDVAIKQLLLTQPSPEALQEFQQEMNLMANLRCPQIVQLYGVYSEPCYGIVMEYMPNGSLYNVLHSNKPLDWTIRYSIAVDITKGVAFLHSENILHRDLKSLNVLLDKHMQAKLTDFGLAKVKNETSSITSNAKVAGTLLWMAPELFKPKARCTKQSDIYSLGMTLWELASRKNPFADAPNAGVALEWVKEGAQEDIPSDCPAPVSKLITFCWNKEVSKRPMADEAVEQLLAEETKSKETVFNFSYRGNLDSGIK